MKNKMIEMQYPYDPNNEVYDGLTHSIVVNALYPLRMYGRDFYIMTYFDNSLNQSMITLIIIVNGIYYKVPLNFEGYSILFNYIQSGVKPLGLTEPAYNIQKPIRLAQSMALLPPDPGNNYNFPTEEKRIPMDYYIPFEKDTFRMNILWNTYRSNGLSSTFADDETYTYNFEKTPIPKPILDGLRIGGKNLRRGKRRTNGEYTNKEGVLYSEFDVDIPEGTFVTQGFVDKEGRVRQVIELVIPGKYYVTGYYAPYYHEDYESSAKCKKLEIDASKENYQDLHDIPIVFRDGGLKLLDMRFDGIPSFKLYSSDTKPL